MSQSRLYILIWILPRENQNFNHHKVMTEYEITDRSVCSITQEEFLIAPLSISELIIANALFGWLPSF